MPTLRSMEGENIYEIRNPRHQRWPVTRTEYSRSDAGSEYYNYGGSGRFQRGGFTATRFNPYSYDNTYNQYGGRGGRAYSEPYGRGGRVYSDVYDSGRRHGRGTQERSYVMGGGMDRLRAASSRGYGLRYYDDDDLSVPRMITSDPYYSRSSYPRFIVPGWAHILLGVLLFVMGLVDIGYTASEFGDGCTYTGTDFDPGPCEANHVYTYVASPIWAGIFMIMTGAVAFWMNPYRLRYNTWLLKTFCGLSVVMIMALCPAIIVLNILEITQNENTFWKEGGDITLEDPAKFSFPIVIVILAFVEWIVSIISVCVCICCPPQGLYFEDKARRYSAPLMEPYRDTRPYLRDPDPVIVHEEVIPGRRGPREEIVRPAYGREEYVSRPRAITAGPYRPSDREGTIVYEERIPGNAYRGRTGDRYDRDDVYTVYSEDTYGGRGRTNYAYARGDDYRGARRERAYDYY